MNHTPLDISEEYMRCWADYKSRVDYPEMRETKVHSFQQTWGDTTCGHGGIGGQAITSAQTFVFESDRAWYVYQAQNFSYQVDDPNQEFLDDLKNWDLVGEVNYDGQYER
jgi:hypothetical protein